MTRWVIVSKRSAVMRALYYFVIIAKLELFEHKYLAL